MWEPVEQLHAPQLLKEYHSRHPLEQIKAALIQRQKLSLPTSECLRSYRLSTAHTASSRPPVTANSSTTHSSSTPRIASTSAPCAPRGSDIVAASTFTSLTRMSSIPPSSIASDPEQITYHSRWPSSMSPLPHSQSNPYSPTIIRTQRPSSHPSSAHHRIRPTNSTSSTLVGSATTPPTPIHLNTNTSAERRTAATTCNQRSTYGPPFITISAISPTGPSRLARTRNVLRRL